MIYTAFTLAVSLVVFAGMSQFLKILLRYPSLYEVFKPDFLWLMVILATLRLCVPGGFMIGIYVPSNAVFQGFDSICETPIIAGWDLLDFLSLIWVIGSIVQLLNLKIRIQKARKEIISDLSKLPRRHIKEFFPEYVGPDYPVYVTDIVHDPCVMAYRNSILLPHDHYSPEEYRYIFLHETQHIFNEDASIKRFGLAFCCIYWWLPTAKRFRNQVELFQELRTDWKVFHYLTREECLGYCESIVSVAREDLKARVRKRSAAMPTSYFANEDKEDLEVRVLYSLNGNTTKTSLIWRVLGALPVVLSLFLVAL